MIAKRCSSSADLAVLGQLPGDVGELVLALARELEGHDPLRPPPMAPVRIVARASVTSAPVRPGVFWKTYQVRRVPASRVCEARPLLEGEEQAPRHPEHLDVVGDDVVGEALGERLAVGRRRDARDRLLVAERVEGRLAAVAGGLGVDRQLDGLVEVGLAVRVDDVALEVDEDQLRRLDQVADDLVRVVGPRQRDHDLVGALGLDLGLGDAERVDAASG